jgi:hypothetical protein
VSEPGTRSEVFRAALDLQNFCREQGWPFCFIGGVALERWAVPRFTNDADMTLLTRFALDQECIAGLLGRFAGRFANAAEFAAQARVLLLKHENGVDLDVALGAFDFEARSIERGSAWLARHGIELFTCSAEDLIVHKAFAARLKDWADIESILAVQGDRLNVPQILTELAPLAELKEDGTIVPRLQQMLRAAGLAVGGTTA